MRRLAMLVILGVLAGAAPAAAADPVLIGEGREAAVAVDAAGTAFIGWIGNEPNITRCTSADCRAAQGAARRR